MQFQFLGDALNWHLGGKISVKTLLVAALLLISAGASKADTLFQYEGNVMSGCNCELEGTFTFTGSFADNTNAVKTWDFSDGTHELTNLNSTGAFGSYIGSDNFREWSFHISSPKLLFISYYYGSGFEATDLSFFMDSQTMFGYEQGNRGTLTQITTPEPGTLLLVGVGLAGLLLKKRKRPVDLGQWEPLA
jgi:hypothetical protein